MSGIRIKKGDLVKVIAGKDKGKEGKVVAIDHKKNTVIVEGANIHISNVMFVHNGKATKIGYKVEDGKKVRVAKATGDVID